MWSSRRTGCGEGRILPGLGRPDPPVRRRAVLRCRPDLRVLAALADELGVDLGMRSSDEARTEMSDWGLGRQRPRCRNCAPDRAGPEAGEAVLAGWRMLVDNGRLQDGEPYLAGTARPPVARLSAATAAGISAPAEVTVSTWRGSVTYRWRSPRCPTTWCGYPELPGQRRAPRPRGGHRGRRPHRGRGRP